MLNLPLDYARTAQLLVKQNTSSVTMRLYNSYNNFLSVHTLVMNNALCSQCIFMHSHVNLQILDIIVYNEQKEESSSFYGDETKC